VLLTRTIANGVLKMRDFLNIPFKFKPWEALKIANLKLIPIIIEAISLIAYAITELKLNKKKLELKEEIEGLFKALMDYFDDTTSSYEEVFPIIKEISEAINQLEIIRSGIQEIISKIDSAINELDAISNI